MRENDLALVLEVEKPLSGGSPDTMFYRYSIGDFELRFTQNKRNGSLANLALRAQGDEIDSFTIEVHEEEVAHRVYYPTEFRVRATAFPRTPEDVRGHLQQWKKALLLVEKLEEFFKTSKHYALFCKLNSVERISRCLDDALYCAQMRVRDENVSECKGKNLVERSL